MSTTRKPLRYRRSRETGPGKACYLPEAFTCRDYLAAINTLGAVDGAVVGGAVVGGAVVDDAAVDDAVVGGGVVGGAVVSGSFQAFDQTYLLAALDALGPSFVGVTQLPSGCSAEQIESLHRAGVRAVRFNLRRGGSASLSAIDTLGRRVFDVAGWHSEFYVRSADLVDLSEVLRRLPRISIDHLGLTTEGLDVLLALVDGGAHVKASGFGRGDLDIPSVISRIHSVNPGALMFGTDLPGTRAPRPFRTSDIDLIWSTLGARDAAKVLHDNAVALYRRPIG